MPKKKKSNNLNLAFLFIILVVGLILISVLFKLIFVIKDSRFDGSHKFTLAFFAKEETDVVSFSPQNKSISILKIDSTVRSEDLAKFLEIPIDGNLKVSANAINGNNVASSLLHQELTIGNLSGKVTSIDILRLYLFARSVSSNSISRREFTKGLSDDQKSTILSLTFTDPQIYQDNQSIEIINATDTFGLGNRLANLITNIGGNVVLVETSQDNKETSQVSYYKDKSYTAKYLSNYLGFEIVKSDKRGVADVIIILGKDSLKDSKF